MPETYKKEFNQVFKESTGLGIAGPVEGKRRTMWVGNVSFDAAVRGILNADLGLKMTESGTKQYTEGASGYLPRYGSKRQYALFEGESRWMSATFKVKVEVWDDSVIAVPSRASQVGYEVKLDVDTKDNRIRSAMGPMMDFAKLSIYTAISTQSIAEMGRAANGLRRGEGK